MARSTSSDNPAAAASASPQGEAAGTANIRQNPAASQGRMLDVDIRMQDQHDRAPGIRLTAEAYFPTLIFFRELPNGPELNARLKPAIYALREEHPEGLVRSNVAKAGSWHSPDNLATRPAFAELSREVVGHASIVFGELGYDPDCGPEISNMWANVHPRHGYNRSHTHPNVLWSGVYYVQSPPRAGRIVFIDPRAQALAKQPIYHAGRDLPPSLWSEVWYEPIEARLLLFPAWLQHEVEPNLSDLPGSAGDRISISFNIVQRRRGAGTQVGGA